jgi:hypothetical protein
MPEPVRTCETCAFWKPYGGSKLLEDTFAKCSSPQKPTNVQFSDTCRGAYDLCGPGARWWRAKPAVFEIVEDGPRALDWDDPEEDI